MSKLKNNSKSLEKAADLSARIKSMKTSQDLGFGLTLESYESQINLTASKLTISNKAVSHADNARKDFEAEEQKLSELNSRFLNAIAAKFGKRSTEYQMVSGNSQNRRKDQVDIKTPTFEEPLTFAVEPSSNGQGKKELVSNGHGKLN